MYQTKTNNLYAKVVTFFKISVQEKHGNIIILLVIQYVFWHWQSFPVLAVASNYLMNQMHQTTFLCIHYLIRYS